MGKVNRFQLTAETIKKEEEIEIQTSNDKSEVVLHKVDTVQSSKTKMLPMEAKGKKSKLPCIFVILLVRCLCHLLFFCSSQI